MQVLLFTEDLPVSCLSNYCCVCTTHTHTDGEWNWDSPSFVVVSQKKDIPVTCMSAARSNMWCAVGNCVTIINSRSLKVEVGAIFYACTVQNIVLALYTDHLVLI